MLFLFLFSFLLFLCDFFSAPLPFTLFSQKVPQYRDQLKLDRSQRNSRRYTCTFSNLNTKRTRRLLEIQGNQYSIRHMPNFLFLFSHAAVFPFLFFTHLKLGTELQDDSFSSTMTKLANFFYNLPLAPKYMHQQISKQVIDTKILEQDLETANTTTRRGTKIQKNNLKRKIAAAKRANGMGKQHEHKNF